MTPYFVTLTVAGKSIRAPNRFEDCTKTGQKPQSIWICVGKLGLAFSTERVVAQRFWEVTWRLEPTELEMKMNHVVKAVKKLKLWITFCWSVPTMRIVVPNVYERREDGTYPLMLLMPCATLNCTCSRRSFSVNYMINNVLMNYQV